MSARAELPSFRQILLVTDFSEPSAAAVPLARVLAKRYGAAVIAAHVLPDAATAAVAEGEPGAKASTAEQAAQTEMQKFLAFTGLPKSPADMIIARGPVAETVANIVREKGIDLVVIGTHGRSGVGKLLLGSVAQRIFNVVPCPVLTVSPRAWTPAEAVGRVLYATDFSEESLHALPYALSLAKTSGTELVLLHVTSEIPGQEILQEYYRRLNALVPSEARTWCKSDPLVMTGTPSEVILRAALEQNADFIVIGAHRAEGTFNVPLTTAYQVVAHSPCAVLRVRG